MNKCYNKTNDDGTLKNIDTVCNELTKDNCNNNGHCIYIEEKNDICDDNYYYNDLTNECDPIICLHPQDITRYNIIET